MKHSPDGKNLQVEASDLCRLHVLGCVPGKARLEITLVLLQFQLDLDGIRGAFMTLKGELLP